MPNDPTPTPLTEAELKSCGEYITSGIPLPRFVQDRLLVAARENAGLREERDDRIRANVRLCEEIKNYRAERDMAQLELSRANVRYEQAHRRAEAMWRERDAALARVAELERKCKLAVEFIEDSSEADCAYPSDPCLRVHISELGHGMCDGCKARRALGYINAPAVFPPGPKPCPPNCDEEGHECVPPPNPKWVRCPKCVNGDWIDGWGRKKSCMTCLNSERPGWVKETPQ